MEAWLEWARGPLFRAAFVFMILGLIRHVVLTLWEVSAMMRRAGDKAFPFSRIAKATVAWLFPLGQLKNRWYYGVMTIVFHVAIILVPIFLLGHIALWQRGLGISWPGLPNRWADLLTIVAVVTAVGCVLQRTVARDTRALARFQDYALPLIIAVPFVTGFLVMHPAMNPFGYEATMLAHVLSANLVLVLIPITKLNHCVLLPTTQLVSELSWHFPPDAGEKVGVALQKENETI